MRHGWSELRSTFWFVPAILVVVALALALGLIWVDETAGLDLVDHWPLVFGSGAAGARTLLSAIATSMVTVAGVVFSITIVALSLTSSQYTSRVLRNFMRDRVNQVVLGVFVGIFAYCIMVLRTIRGADEGAFVPSLAIMVGLVLAFVGIGFLIYFIHHVATSIQASSIIAAAADETLITVDRLFPSELGEDPEDPDDDARVADLDDAAWSVVTAPANGYIASVDGDALLALAQRRDAIVRMDHGVGDFVIAGMPLASVAGGREDDDGLAAELQEVFAISRFRTVAQDVAFGVRQIVDVALKALSPGINDSTTAVMCVDYLTAILVRLAPRKLVSRLRLDDTGALRVIARGPSFGALLDESFEQNPAERRRQRRGARTAPRCARDPGLDGGPARAPRAAPAAARPHRGRDRAHGGVTTGSRGPHRPLEPALARTRLRAHDEA